ncbi:LmbE family protein [Hymenobacter sp. DG25B]|uniref:PIG-L family deacetylase n=1 Tax=Hymenobacter sp. DG25B TaxID=1385664 RepID=UPI0005407BF9|nr:PIG-L family deacetylase [Hymenobacter sp. DG25B]AIZ63405.1 LmbE family protein [Hymenobacter sp. DG25B]
MRLSFWWNTMVLAFLLPFTTLAQAPKTYSSSEILLGLKKLNVLGSVLYIAAHPDDENTRLIAYMANGRLLETGYFSCTRGDGGQNLIGPELREQLGVIRTQELLAARRIDGGRQFFSRANDFGFSKTAEETFTIWDKEQVLSDMVWVIRQRRPDVLITRFPPDARAGHGHHTASAMLAIEAFDAAGDPKRFPEQLKYVQPWQPKRLLWNTGSFFVKAGEDMSGYLKLDAGGYNPLLGLSYGEIAARSRSQHKSQGFGSAATRGEALEYFQLLKGEKAEKDLFEGVDMSWNRVKGGAAVGKLLEEVIQKYDAANPAASVAGLLKVRATLRKLKVAPLTNEKFWVEQKENQVNELIRATLGLYLEATASSSSIVAGENVPITIEVTSRLMNSKQLPKADLISIMYSGQEFAITAVGKEDKLPAGRQSLLKREVAFMASDTMTSQPYWLNTRGSIGMYKVEKQLERGQPETGPSIEVTFEFLIGSQSIDYTVPVQYKSTDPVEGEKYRPLAIVPPVAVNIVGHAYVFAENKPKTVPVTLKAGQADAKGTVALQVPTGWKVEPASIPFDIKNKDEERTVEFQVQPTSSQQSTGQLRAVATMNGQAYSRGIQTIAYNHIPTQTLFPEAVAPLVKLDLKRRKQDIGYLMGAGDEVPDALRQIGYNVTLLKPEDLTTERLRRYQAVVVGIRAYNTLDRLKYQQPTLLQYVENGGNLVVQYTVSRGTVLPEIGPYPMKLSNDRVTVENAAVTFLKPQHALLNTPNKISSQDFEGWQQEQGLYYPSQWDPKYQTIISSHDPGEPAKESAILVADYGKGHYIYTGLSFFRELPAGVPGAYRLLTNMIELGK